MNEEELEYYLKELEIPRQLYDREFERLLDVLEDAGKSLPMANIEKMALRCARAEMNKRMEIVARIKERAEKDEVSEEFLEREVKRFFRWWDE